METIGDRLQIIIHHYNKNANSFATSLEVRDTPIRNILAGKTKPSYDLIVKILTKYYAINPIWFIEGTGEMFKEDQQSMMDQLTKGETLSRVPTRINVLSNHLQKHTYNLEFTFEDNKLTSVRHFEDSDVRTMLRTMKSLELKLSDLYDAIEECSEESKEFLNEKGVYPPH